MNRALELHHRLVRSLLDGHAGYESATEGDSFILAFHTPLDAVRLAQVRAARAGGQDHTAGESRSLLEESSACMRFCHATQALQAGLMLVNWPPELLGCELAAPVWVQVCGILKTRPL